MTLSFLLEPTPCAKCERLVKYRSAIKPKKSLFLHYHNNPVLPFGDESAWLLICGLAPGAHGANRTGRVFTGDGAGELLYRALFEAGLSTGPESVSADDGLDLKGVIITNALLCVPPGNKALPSEFNNCRPNLEALLAAKPLVTDILCIGRDAFIQVCKVLGERAHEFKNNGEYRVGRYKVWAIYHCSRLNQNTGRIKMEDMVLLLKRIKKAKNPGNDLLNSGVKGGSIS